MIQRGDIKDGGGYPSPGAFWLSCEKREKGESLIFVIKNY